MSKIQGSDVDVEPNGVECMECDRTYSEVEARDASEDFDTCPEDDEHAVLPVHVTATPLGLPNDADFLHHGMHTYVYSLEL